MKVKAGLIVALALIGWVFSGWSQSVFRESFCYETLDSDTLSLDYYYASRGDQLRPTIIFVHGGSFMTGHNRVAYVIPYAMEWVRHGYNVVAINYRLTLKGKTFHCDLPQEEKIRTFEHAVYDLRAATRFVLQHYDTLRVDTQQIIIAGNSAGAETVLHAAYWSTDEHNVGPPLLSDSFRYVAVIAYAGAVLDTQLIQPANAIPTALFHGTCDEYVPYATAYHHYCAEGTPGALRLQGSYDIAQRLHTLHTSYFLYTVVNGTHRVNTLGMAVPLDQTIAFIKHVLHEKTLYQEHLTEVSSEEKCTFTEVDFCK